MDTISIIIGCCSLIIAALGYRHSISQLNEYEFLAEKLCLLREEDFRPSRSERKVFQLLENGSLIFPLLKSKIQRRLIDVMVLITVFLFAEYLDFNKYFSYDLFDTIANFVFLSAAFISAFSVGNFVVTKEEKEFLNNLKALNELYYKNFIVPALRLFNKACTNEAIIKSEKLKYRIMLKEVEREVRIISRKANKSSKRDAVSGAPS